MSFNETVIGIIVMEVWQRKTELPVNRNAVAETSGKNKNYVAAFMRETAFHLFFFFFLPL